MRLFLSLFLFSLPLFAVINISPNEIGLRPGLSGNIQVAINNQRGNTDKDEYDFSAKVNYDNNRSYVTWLAFSYAYGQAAGVENENKAYLHYRFIHNFFSHDWNWEFFAQNQGDDFRKIQRRLLGGAGLRWRFINGDTFGRIYAGLGAYYEYVNYTDPVLAPKEYNSRLNAYLSYTKKFGKDARVSLATYYQPKFDNWSDHYLLSTASLLFYVYGSIYVKASLTYAYDTKPPTGVQKEDMQQISSIGWKFGAKSNR